MVAEGGEEQGECDLPWAEPERGDGQYTGTYCDHVRDLDRKEEYHACAEKHRGSRDRGRSRVLFIDFKDSHNLNFPLI